MNKLNEIEREIETASSPYVLEAIALSLLRYVREAELAFGQFYPGEETGRWDNFKAARRRLGLGVTMDKTLHEIRHYWNSQVAQPQYAQDSIVWLINLIDRQQAELAELRAKDAGDPLPAQLGVFNNTTHALAVLLSDAQPIVAGLRREIKELDEAVTAALKDRDYFDTELRKAEAELAELRQVGMENQELKAEIAALRAELGNDMGLSRIHELYNEIDSQKAEIARLRVENERLNKLTPSKEIDELYHTVDELRAQLDKAKSLIDAAKAGK